MSNTTPRSTQRALAGCIISPVSPEQRDDVPIVEAATEPAEVSFAVAQTVGVEVGHALPPAVGRYTIKELVGEGGMGVVYAGEDPDNGQAVAVKVLRNELGGAEGVRRFEREVEVLAQLNHPGIVRYLDHGVGERGRPFLVMQWLDGEDLAERLERGALTVQQSRLVAQQAAEALAYAHSRDIVHRDVKPSNMFLPGGDIERVMLLDFGVARLMRPGRTITVGGAMIGTPGYMAPEQVRGEQDVNARADVFSLTTASCSSLSGASRCAKAAVQPRRIPAQPSTLASISWG